MGRCPLYCTGEFDLFSVNSFLKEMGLALYCCDCARRGGDTFPKPGYIPYWYQCVTWVILFSKQNSLSRVQGRSYGDQQQRSTSRRLRCIWYLWWAWIYPRRATGMFSCSLISSHKGDLKQGCNMLWTNKTRLDILYLLTTEDYFLLSIYCLC